MQCIVRIFIENKKESIMSKRITLSIIAIVAVISCTKINLEPNQSRQMQESLADLWGTNYSIHRIEHIQGYQVVDVEYFCNTNILNKVLSNLGQDTTSFTDSFRDTLTITDYNNYLSAFGQNYFIDLDTIYKSFWNSHGTICYSPNIGFIDANSTKWDELPGVTSSPEPHKSFTIMIPVSAGGNEIVYHFVNNSNPPTY